MKWATQKAFTIVELLIVIVVIAILAAITLVAYNGIRERAEQSAAETAVAQAARKIEAAAAASVDGLYPADITSTGLSSAEYQYSRSADGLSFCVTTVYNNSLPYNVAKGKAPAYGPCDGHNGGPSYCPTDTYVPMNGFYCDGTVGQTASLNSSAVKLNSTDGGVPAGAPGAYVGRQTNRDNYLSNLFPVSTGETYCIEGWAATATSTVPHTVGLHLMTSGGTNSWQASSYASASQPNTWQKIQGCITVPSGYVNARVWSQNNGNNGSTADPAWYQTAIRFYKQS